MQCASCGKDSSSAGSFCEFCGFDLRRAVPAGGAGAVAVATSAPAAAATATAIVEASKTFVKSLTIGEQFTAAGALAAVLGFVLPFVSTPDLGSLSTLMGQMSGSAATPAQTSISLFGLARYLGAIYFILLAAIGAAGLVWLSRGAPNSRKLVISGFQVMIGSLLGPLAMLNLLFVPFIQTVAGVGYWFTGLGFCAIAAGGLITIMQLAKSTR